MRKILYHTLLSFALFVTSFSATNVWANAAAVDSIIRNRASASFYTSDVVGVQFIQSNIVETRVAAQENLLLQQNQSYTLAPGQGFVLPHTLVNTGNVSSTYQLKATTSSTLALQLFIDRNSNGMVDAGDARVDQSAVAADWPALDAGARLQLLIIGQVPSDAAQGTKIDISLDAKTANQLGANNLDKITVIQGANFNLSKFADKTSPVSSGEVVTYKLQASNVGSQAAQALDIASNSQAQVLTTGVPDTVGRFNVRVNGVAESKIIYRDRIPQGSSFVANSLQTNSSLPGLQKLYRAAGAAPFDYSTSEVGTIVEVALAADTIAPTLGIQLEFKVRVNNAFSGVVKNTAELFYYGNGLSDQSLGRLTNEVSLYTFNAPSPDVVLSKTHAGVFAPDQENIFQFKVTNIAALPTTEPIVLTDALPDGMEIMSASGAGWVCDQANTAKLRCTWGASLPASSIYAESQTATLNLKVKVKASILDGKEVVSVVNTAQISGGGELPAQMQNNSASDTVQISSLASVSGKVWWDESLDRIWQASEKGLAGWRAEVVLVTPAVSPSEAPKILVVKSALSDALGNYIISGVPARDDYALRFISPEGVWYGTPVNGEYGKPVTKSLIETGAISDFNQGLLVRLRLPPGGEAVQQSMPVQPTGIVYDSLRYTPLAGAKLEIIGPDGFIPAAHLIGGASSQGQTTGANGFYYLSLNSKAPAGVYKLQVTAPTGYLFVSQIILPKANYVGKASAPNVDKATEASTPLATGDNPYYLQWQLSANDRALKNNHIPLDPTASATGLGADEALVLDKQVSKTTAEVLDVLDYTVTLKNLSKRPLQNLYFQDLAPYGFNYLATTAKWRLADGSSVSVEPTRQANGQGGVALRFALDFRKLASTPISALGPKQSLILQYRMQVSPSAIQGDGVNTAIAKTLLPANLESNPAQAKVLVRGGVFSKEGYIFGKVFLDCNKSGEQDHGEVGIPGVRLYLEDGSFVVTDNEGKYSVYGLQATSHVLKVDAITVPEGSFFGSTRLRNSGVAWIRKSAEDNKPMSAVTQLIDLKSGELHKANFAEQNCSAAILADVADRRSKAGSLSASELSGVVKSIDRFRADAKPQELGDLKVRPAAGLISRETGQTSAAAQKEYEVLSASVLTQGPISEAKTISNSDGVSMQLQPLEDLLPNMDDNKLAFVNLNNGQTLPFSQSSIQIKGRMGAKFQLLVNGKEVPNGRVGKRSILGDKQLEAWEYVAVDLQKGKNQIQIKAMDDMGQVREAAQVEVLAPGSLAKLELKAESPLLADGRTRAQFKLRLLDSEGLTVTTRTPITLKTSAGEWLNTDLSQAEEGVQIFAEGGEVQLWLKPPFSPQNVDVDIRASGLVVLKQKLEFLPELRPLIAAGVIDVNWVFRQFDISKALPVRSADSFERELQQFSYQTGNSETDKLNARTAFFIKGKVKGDYLLTAAFDSEKQERNKLFRDIQPDEYYPIYGDSSVRGFDAQASGKLFVRLDKDKSFALLGDFSSGGSTERQLSAYSRSAYGAKVHLDEAIAPNTMPELRLQAEAFASRDSQRQVREELAANGTTGLFALKFNNMVLNSERVEIIVRDRNQPSLELNREQGERLLQRFIDYSIEPDSGQLRLKSPLASFDSQGNPQYIRVSYEVDAGGEKFWQYGAEVVLNHADKNKIGISSAVNQDPAKPQKISGVFATTQINDAVKLSAELAYSVNGVGSGSGNQPTGRVETERAGKAGRVALEVKQDKLLINAQYARAGKDFESAGANLSAGRSEAFVKGSYELSQGYFAEAEYRDSVDRLTGARLQGTLLGLKFTDADYGTVEIGTRAYRQDQPQSTNLQSLSGHTLRFKAMTKLAFAPRLGLGVEYEQDFGKSQGRLLALNADYAFVWGRVYARHELSNSLGNLYNLNDSVSARRSVMGIDANYSDNGKIYSEYRIADSLNARSAQAALGIKHRLSINSDWAINAGAEQVTPVGAVTNSVSSATSATNANSAVTASLSNPIAERNTAVSLGLEYTGSPDMRLMQRLEWRKALTQQQLDYSLAGAYKLNADWSVLARGAILRIQNQDANQTRTANERVQIGAAYRPVDEDYTNAIAKLEYRNEKQTSLLLSQALNTSSYIASIHINQQPSQQLHTNSYAAAKWVQARAGESSVRSHAQLAYVRIGYDLNERLDIGAQAFAMRSSNAPTHYGYGLEAGLLMQANVWLSMGYNFFGVRDDELAGPYTTQKGAYLRLRMKFDENGL